MQRMEDVGLDLVEVSSHVGAKPSHREWEGRCYSLSGRQVIGGAVYEDYREACRVGDLADGIYGYNCRHSVGPYVHGAPRAYEPSPSHPSGLSSEEVYELTQGQRARERAIRAAKRELRGAQRLYDDEPTPGNALELQKARDRLRRRQADMRAYIEKTNSKGDAPVLVRNYDREWAGDMPKGRRISPSMRGVDEFMAMPSVQRSMKAHGITKTQLRAMLSEELADQGGIRAFAGLTRSEQQAMSNYVIMRREGSKRANRVPASSALKESIIADIEDMGFIVEIGTDEAMQMLRDSKDLAVTIEAWKKVYFREEPPMSELLEEQYHVAQAVRGDYIENGYPTTTYLREIDAKNYLLDAEKLYNIPIEEHKDTINGLKYYKRRMKRHL